MKSSLVIMLLGLVALGCDEEGVKTAQVDPVVSIELRGHTLWLSECDTSRMEVDVLVKNQDGTAMAGIPVEMSINDISLGYIIPRHPELWNFTSEEGRVSLWFVARGNEGDAILTAQAGRAWHSQAIPIRQEARVATEINFDTNADTDTIGSVFYPPEALIRINVQDQCTEPFAGIDIMVELAYPELGTLEFYDSNLQGTTNSEGNVELIYTTSFFDTLQIIYASHEIAPTQMLRDSQRIIFVRTPWDPPTLNVHCYDTAIAGSQGGIGSAEVCAVVRNENGEPVTGAELEWEIINGIHTPFPPTNEGGRTCNSVYVALDSSVVCFAAIARYGLLVDTAFICLPVISPSDTLYSIRSISGN